jgi:hypothetical protein
VSVTLQALTRDVLPKYLQRSPTGPSQYRVTQVMPTAAHSEVHEPPLGIALITAAQMHASPEQSALQTSSVVL